MNQVSPQVEFFARISYKGSQPQLAIVPTFMPGNKEALPQIDSAGSGPEGHITVSENVVEIPGLENRRIRLDSITADEAADGLGVLGDQVGILSVYKHFQAEDRDTFENFLLAATKAAHQCQWSAFPMYFPDSSK
jgi:hypothetical protein